MPTLASPPITEDSYHSDTSSSSSRQVLEISSTPDSRSVLDAPMMWSLSGHLPSHHDSTEADSDTVPSLDPGYDTDIIWEPPSVEELLIHIVLTVMVPRRCLTFLGSSGCSHFPSSIPPYVATGNAVHAGQQVTEAT